MSYFERDFKLPEWFGDFGGSLSADTDLLINSDFAPRAEDALKDPRFETMFREVLNHLVPEKWTYKTYSVNGKTMYVVPKLSGYYNVAGQVVVAKLMGYEQIKAGSYCRGSAVALAKACKFVGLKCFIVLGRKASVDQELLDELHALGAEYENTVCLKQVDVPYGILLVPFCRPDWYTVALDGNLGRYPIPGLVGALASIYGKEIKEALADKIDACVIPITTGTEAVGVFGGLMDTDVAMATCEEPISQEFHLGESGTYTIATRSALYDQANTTICPELANWWHKARVSRLGCDKLGYVNVDAYEGTGLNALEARAAELAFTDLKCDKLLVVGGHI